MATTVRLETEVDSVHIVPRKNYCFARTHLYRRFVTHLNGHAAHHDVVVENDVLDVGEERTAVIRFDPGGEAPRLVKSACRKTPPNSRTARKTSERASAIKDSRGFFSGSRARNPEARSFGQFSSNPMLITCQLRS
jgi:hypothetical protein